MGKRLTTQGIAASVAAVLALGMGLAAPALGQPIDRSVVASASFAGSYLAGRSALEEQDVDAAIAFLGRAKDLEPDAFLISQTFNLNLASGEMGSAVRLANELIESTPDNLLANLTLAVEAAKRGRFGEARDRLKAVGTDELADVTVGLIGAWVDQALGNTDEALARLEEVTGITVYNSYHGGLIAAEAGRQEQALELMTKAFEFQDPAPLWVAEALARLKARAGDSEAAEAILKTYEDQLPGYPPLDRLRSDLAAGRTPPPTIDSPAAGMAEALNGLGLILGDRGAGVLATAYLHLAIHLDPDADLALASLGEILQQSGRIEEAIGVFEKIAPGSPMYDHAQLQVAISLSALERTEAAIDKLKQIVAAHPTNLDAALALSDLQRGEEQFADSVEILTASIGTIDEIAPEHWRLFYYRGIGYERTKQWPRAEADFKQALALNPDQPHVLNYLGYSWVDMGMNLDEALEMIRQAIELSQNDGNIVDSLGWAYYRLGRYDDAVEQLERAVELVPDEPVINDHLGDAYWRVGRQREARYQWSHALTFEPDAALRPVIEDKLENGLGPEPKPEISITPDEARNDTAVQPAAERIATITPTQDGPAEIVVAPGDSLWSLAEKFYGDPELYGIIYNANRDRIANPNVIVPGMTLSLPKAAATN